MREKLGIPNTIDHQGANMTDQQQTTETRPQSTEQDGLSASDLPKSLYESERSPQEVPLSADNFLSKSDKKFNRPGALIQGNDTEGVDTTADGDVDPADTPVTTK